MPKKGFDFCHFWQAPVSAASALFFALEQHSNSTRASASSSPAPPSSGFDERRVHSHCGGPCRPRNSDASAASGSVRWRRSHCSDGLDGALFQRRQRICHCSSTEGLLQRIRRTTSADSESAEGQVDRLSDVEGRPTATKQQTRRCSGHTREFTQRNAEQHQQQRRPWPRGCSRAVGLEQRCISIASASQVKALAQRGLSSRFVALVISRCDSFCCQGRFESLWSGLFCHQFGGSRSYRIRRSPAGG